MDITLDTDWGARGAQLTGAQIQAFIKQQFRDLIAKDTELAQSISGNTKAVENKIKEIATNLTLAQLQLNALSDSCYIAYHRKIDNWPVAVHYLQWPEIEESGEVADGVLVLIDGHTPILIAPTDQQLLWSKVNYGVDLRVGTDHELAYSDFSGQTRTAAFMARRQELYEITDIEDTSALAYAAPWCFNYDRSYQYTNPITDKISTIGVLKNKWWLPSIAELMIIWKHRDAVNRCLSVIKDATPLKDAWYWSSTEATATTVWRLHMGTGAIQGGNNKINFMHQTRAITSFYDPMIFNNDSTDESDIDIDTSKWTRIGDCAVYVDNLVTPIVVKYPLTAKKIQLAIIHRQYTDKEIALIQTNYQLAQSEDFTDQELKQVCITNYNNLVACQRNALKLSKTALVNKRPNVS